MTEKLKQTLRDSKKARWTTLVVVAILMFAGYFFTDVMSPLKPMLEAEMGWTSSDYGFFTSAYGWFNVFLLLLIVGGIILDKMGVRFTGVMAAAIMVVGASIKYWAISTIFDADDKIFDISAQVVYAALGFAIFAVGVEIAGITVSKVIVKWFKGYEMAMAMGFEMAIARLGTALALASPVPLYTLFDNSISAPLAFGLVLLVIGLISFLAFNVMDKKLDKSVVDSGAEKEEEDNFKISDLGLILKNKGFWLIAFLCVLFYSSVFPFLKYAADLMVNKYGVDPGTAGLIPSLLPFGTLFLTPFFGNLYDRKGKGATIMIIGSAMLIGVHTLFSIPFLDHWLIAVALVLVLGVAFSLVPAAMWPSVPKIIPEKQLGSAFSLIFWIQNWGLMGVPYLIGVVLDKYCITGSVTLDGLTRNTYDYTLPMMIFTGFGILAIFVALALKAEDKKKGYGLELPNM
ncbi:MAG: MFS transporter, partial [Chlorobi bacterium]|nr:MFS transporter [Chlorobiota bacterium]